MISCGSCVKAPIFIVAASMIARESSLFLRSSTDEHHHIDGMTCAYCEEASAIIKILPYTLQLLRVGLLQDLK